MSRAAHPQQDGTRGPERRGRLIRRGVLLALLLAAGAARLSGQESASGDLSGRVIDSEMGAPVSQARVFLEGTADSSGGPGPTIAGDRPEEDRDVRIQSITDSDGRFRLTSVPSGSHVLTVEHLAYGEHERRLQVEGAGSGRVEVTVSPTAIELEPLVVASGGSESSDAMATPSSRNTLDRSAIASAASSGMSLSDLLDREVAGIYVQRNSAIGSPPCVEFRGARRGDDRCRPPQLIVDGTSVPDPLSRFGFLSLEGVQQIRVIPPSEAGVRFGPNAGWGVVLVETRQRNPLENFAVPVVERRPMERRMVDWSVEADPYPWKRVYAAAFLGNAAGLLAGSAVLSQCMDLGTQRFYRGDEYCGAGLLLASGIAMSGLPALGGSFAGKLAGSTPRSRGDLGRSILHSAPVFVPGFAIASLNSGSSGFHATDVLGIGLVVFGAPALNTLSDHVFRRSR